MKSGQYPVWMNRKPRKGDLKDFKKIQNISLGSLPPDKLARSVLVQEISQYLS